MYINRPSVTKVEAVDRVNLLHNTGCGFKQYESLKPGQMFVSVTKKTPAFRHRNLTLDNFIKIRSILKQLRMWLVDVVKC